MKHPVLTCVLLAAVIIAFVFLAPMPGESQARTGKPYTPPKTPWGDPDLQGVWPSTEMIGVPLQRPPQFGTRNVLTEEEFRQRQLQAERTAEADSQEFKQDGSSVGINPPSHWIDRGKPQMQASLLIDPPDGRLPALTPEAQTLAAERAAARKTRGPADSWEDRSLYERCITRGVLGLLPVIYNNGTQIVQAPGVLVFRYEMIHEARVIPLDGRAQVGSGIRTYMGNSRGRWEGNTLVIETTNFMPYKTAVGGTPTSEDFKLTERLTRVADDTLLYQATVDDPKTWTKPWTLSLPLKRDLTDPMFEYACHEGNYALEGILSGARAEEKAAEEARKQQQD
jgi:hypothetical protein